MHGLHYNHQKKFTENKFKEWSKKASKLRDTYTDEQIEEFKNKLNELGASYYKWYKNTFLLIERYLKSLYFW